MRRWSAVGLVCAAVCVGLTAGVFGDWAHTIMPGLGATDDRTFVTAFQALDRAILNPVFLLTFLGALVFTGIAVLAHRREGGRWWIVAAFGLYLVAVVITLVVHEPLNTVLRAAGDPGRIVDPAALRVAFDEARWATWHLVRTAATTAAFGCLLCALVRRGGVPATSSGP